MPSARVEQALERLSEDSSLTGDLTDPEATQVLAWAERQIMAADEAGADNSFASQVAAIRAAIRAAARPTDDALPVAERAQRALRSSAVHVDRALAAAAVEPKSKNSRVAPGEQPPSLAAIGPAAPPLRSPWQSLRRKIQRWTHRKVS